ncbi:hypothetical protein FJT64_014287 [Amphibalanus amphitrite]|uniref:DUF5641 domain-containing protein n=1 Tax=Amphibalanus amphitrite TaxID=1232801 RepID=A0A6A4UU72_AMPAM|nr:hypothetical protein FJT64_014287 [Amphibalanus amphitrite]
MKFVQHLELELLEEEEYDHQPSAVDRQALARPAAAAPSEPAAQLCEPLQPGDRSSRTRDWVEQSSQYGQLCLHYDADISAATNVTAVISKLPAALALKWGEHSVHNGLVRPTLPDLDSWLRGYVAAGHPADVQLDELALVTKDNLPRGHWLLERVVTVFPGADSRVQVVKVATATGRKFGIGAAGRSQSREALLIGPCVTREPQKRLLIGLCVAHVPQKCLLIGLCVARVPQRRLVIGQLPGLRRLLAALAGTLHLLAHVLCYHEG